MHPDVPAAVRAAAWLSRPRGAAVALAAALAVGGGALGPWLVAVLGGDMVVAASRSAAAGGPGGAWWLYGPVLAFCAVASPALGLRWAWRGSTLAQVLLDSAGAGVACAVVSTAVLCHDYSVVFGALGGLVMFGPIGALLGLVHGLVYQALLRVVTVGPRGITLEQALARSAAWLAVVSAPPALLAPPLLGALPGILCAALAAATALVLLGVRSGTWAWARRVAVGRVPALALDAPSTAHGALPGLLLPAFGPHPEACAVLVREPEPTAGPFRASARRHGLVLVPTPLGPGATERALLVTALVAAAVLAGAFYAGSAPLPEAAEPPPRLHHCH